MKNVERFLEIENKRLSIVLSEEQWYVAIKPLCELLGVDYEAQRKRISNDEILSQLPSIQTVVAADGKQREMLCLPERFIYGWLFSVQSDSPILARYKLECYEVLYKHFHGAIQGRVNLLTQKMDNEQKIIELQNAVQEKAQLLEEQKRIEELKKENKQLERALKDLDKNLIEGQYSMPFPEKEED